MIGFGVGARPFSMGMCGYRRQMGTKSYRVEKYHLSLSALALLQVKYLGNDWEEVREKSEKQSEIHFYILYMSA